MAKKGKETETWQNHYLFAVILAIIIIAVAIPLNFLSTSGAIIVASIAATVVILFHKYRHHMTSLGTILFAYFIAGVFSIALVALLRLGDTPQGNQAIIVAVIIGYTLYWLDLFHFPAVAFGLAFIIYERGTASYFWLLIASLFLFIVIRLLMYIAHEHLNMKDFIHELIREEKAIIAKEENIIIKKIKR